MRTRFVSVRLFFRWALDEAEVEADPTARIKRSAPAEQPVEFARPEQVQALLKSLEGRDFTSRRDAAVVRLWADTGIRRAELGNLTVDDLDGDPVRRVRGPSPPHPHLADPSGNPAGRPLPVLHSGMWWSVVCTPWHGDAVSRQATSPIEVGDPGAVTRTSALAEESPSKQALADRPGDVPEPYPWCLACGFQHQPAEHCADCTGDHSAGFRVTPEAVAELVRLNTPGFRQRVEVDAAQLRAQVVRFLASEGGR